MCEITSCFLDFKLLNAHRTPPPPPLPLLCPIRRSLTFVLLDGKHWQCIDDVIDRVRRLQAETHDVLTSQLTQNVKVTVLRSEALQPTKMTKWL